MELMIKSGTFLGLLCNKNYKRFCILNLFLFRAIGDYLDPVFKGVHIEVLGRMEETKAEIMRRWDVRENTRELTMPEIDARMKTKILTQLQSF